MSKRRTRERAIFGFCNLLLALSSATASAQVAAASSSPASDSGERHGAGRTSDSAQAGMFLPFSEAPRTDSARAFTTALGGYDGARNSAMLEGRGEVTVYGPIALRVGVLYTQSPEQLRPTVGARVQALSQADEGIDMSIGAFYKPEGFTEGEGELEGVFAFGRRFGRAGIVGDLVYGQDPEARERDGEVRLAALYTATARLQFGFDSRVRFDLGTEQDKLEEEGGAEYDLIAGPLLSYTLGEVAVGVQGGLSVLGTPSTKLGPIALLTLSGSL
jgi:hypothetical protein